MIRYIYPICMSPIPLLIVIGLYGCSARSPYYGQIEDASEYQCSEKDDLKHRILFIGDAGEPGFENSLVEGSVASDDTLRELCPEESGGGTPDACLSSPTLVTLYTQAKISPDNTTIIFLGDNVYPNGLSSQNDYESRSRLEAQLLTATKSGAKVLFVPGNRLQRYKITGGRIF